MATLDELIKHSKRTFLCLEVNPPRGTELEEIFSRLEGKLNGIDFFNVTDSALARMRFAALPFASILKQRLNIEPLVNLSCRDRNLIALQADLLAGWATGVRSVVALTGDAVTIGDSPERKGVFEVNSIGLLHAINTLNAGKDLAGNELKGTPRFYPGVVVNPNANNRAAEIKRLAKKKEAGALYALSQPVFDESVSAEFFREAQSVGIPILMGLLPLKTLKAVSSITNVPGIKITPELKNKFEATAEKDLAKFSIDHCLKLAEINRDFVGGFHVVSGTTPKLAMQLAQELSEWVKVQ